MVEITPQADHTIRERPAEPVSLITPVGVTKMPEPMMVPMIIPTPLKRVMLRLRTIFSPLAGEPWVGVFAGEVRATGVDGDPGSSVISPSWSASAPAAGQNKMRTQSLTHEAFRGHFTATCVAVGL